MHKRRQFLRIIFSFLIRHLKQLRENAYLTKSNCYAIRITFSYFSFDIAEQLLDVVLLFLKSQSFFLVLHLLPYFMR